MSTLGMLSGLLFASVAGAAAAGRKEDWSASDAIIIFGFFISIGGFAGSLLGALL